MTDTPLPGPDTFVIETASFYARSGFEGGEILRPAFPKVSGGELRELLVDVLHKHVIPVLDQTLQTLQVPTALNPLRATSIDGVPVTWTTAAMGSGPPLTPATVTVTKEQVLALARKRRMIPAAPTT